MKKLLKKLLAPMIREVIEEEIAKAHIQDDVKRWMDTLSNIKSQGVAIACNIDEDTNMEAIHQDKKLESLSLSAHPVKAKSTNTMKRKSYDSAFKQRAI
ncbi:MAG: hypothetical protein SNJ29_14395, partial [Rikenellaceae bacterium]